MQKELGKWLMDVSKYIATAVIISSFFNQVKSTWLLYLVGMIAVATLLAVGLRLTTLPKKQSKKSRLWERF